MSNPLAQANNPDKGTWKIAGKSGLVGTHAALLYTGQVLFFTRPEEVSHKWNLLNNGLPGDDERQKGDRDVSLSTIIETSGTHAFQPTAVQVINNPFCSGHTFLPDGNLLVAGGDKKNFKHPRAPANTESGLNSLRVFAPDTGTWVTIGQISDCRWYPTCTLLADGRVFIISGNLDDITPTYNDQNPTCETIPAASGGAQYLHFLVEAWPYHSYPFVFALPSNELFVFVKNKSFFLRNQIDEWNRERWIATKGPELFKNGQGHIEEPAKHYPNTATAVLLPLLPIDNYQAEIMIIGGAGANVYPQWADNIIPGFNCKTHEINAVKNCFRLKIDPINPASQDWKMTQPLNIPRVMPDAVLLPDGKILVVNGISKGFAGGNPATGPMLAAYAVKQAEIYDPALDQWQTMEEANCPRLYHSTALLLPDASVMIAGSDHQTNAHVPMNLAGDEYQKTVALSYEYKIEIFYPPYLTVAVSRPSYELLDSVGFYSYSQIFSIKISDLQNLKPDKLSVCLIAPGSVTHCNNMSQRLIGLSIADKSDVLKVEMPQGSNIAPPGYYMLFVLYDGIPSEAKFVRLLPGKVDKEVAVPLPTLGMALWLRADRGVIADANLSLYSWSDFSGNAMDVYWTPNGFKSSNGAEPRQCPPKLVYNELNGHAVIRFSLIQIYEEQWGSYLKSVRNFLPDLTSFVSFIVFHPWPSGQDGPYENINNNRRGTPGLFCWGEFNSQQSKSPYMLLRMSPGPRSQEPPDGNWINHLPTYPGRASVVSCFGKVQLGNDMIAPVLTEKAILIESEFDGERFRIKINGNNFAESDMMGIEDMATGPLIIGRNGNNGDFFRGDIAEFIVYNRRITAEERAQIQEYLRSRYALW